MLLHVTFRMLDMSSVAADEQKECNGGAYPYLVADLGESFVFDGIISRNSGDQLVILVS